MDTKRNPKNSKIYKLPPIWKQRRTLIAVLLSLGSFNSYCLRVNLMGTIESMKNSKPNKSDHIFSWFFIGYMTTQLTGGLLSCRFGGVKIFGFGVLGAAILTLFTPLVLGLDTNIYLIVIRTMIGIFEGVTFPSVFAIWSRWAPVGQQIWLSSLAFSGGFMGATGGYLLCGLLSDKWEYVFYITGIVSIIWSIVWLTCIAETPEEDENITTEELNYIVNSVHRTGIESDYSKYPLKFVFTSKPIWAVACAHFATNWGNFTLISQLPIYLRVKWNCKSKTANFSSALPYFWMATCLQISVLFARFLKKNEKLTIDQIGKICMCVALISQVVFMFLTAYAQTEYIAIFYLSMALGIGSLVWLGIIINLLLIAPQYASISIAISNTLSDIPGILSPILADHITKSNPDPNSWDLVFLIASGVSMFGIIMILVFSSGKRQPWAEDAKDKKKDIILIKRRNSMTLKRQIDTDSGL